MKGIFSVITLISFVGIAVFGLWGMGGHMNSFSSCLGSLSQGASCPINPTASVNFHLNSFKSFSNSPVPQSAESMIMISLTLTLIFAYILIIERFQLSSTVLSLNRENLVRIFEESFQPFKKERTSWNTLHENSPNSPKA
jgi:polyferredoxin